MTTTTPIVFFSKIVVRDEISDVNSTGIISRVSKFEIFEKKYSQSLRVSESQSL